MQEPERSSIRHFSLMNALLNVLNNTDLDDTDNVLARYFLEHFDRLDRLNVYDVAEACYTSRSGIRRFCQRIGCDHFSDLKSYSWEWNRHRALFDDFAGHADYRGFLSAGIAGMMEEVNALATHEVLDQLAARIRDAQKLVLLTSDFSSMAVREFQQAMLYQHKVVQIITDSFGDIDFLRGLTSRDLVLVISGQGNYARAVLPTISNTPAPRLLITTSHDEALAAEFDGAYLLSQSEQTAQRTVFTQYGVMYFFDLLYNRYTKLSAA